MSHRLLFLLLLLSPLPAKTIEGVEVPESLVVDGQTIPLHRTAVRRQLGFKVYFGALYLKTSPPTPQAVIDTTEPIVLRMYYKYMSIPHRLFVGGMQDHFDKALGKTRGGFTNEFTRYVAGYDRGITTGDIVEVVWKPSTGVCLVMSGKTNVTVPGLPFKKVLFSSWFGDNAPDLSFRRDLLGPY